MFMAWLQEGQYLLRAIRPFFWKSRRFFLALRIEPLFIAAPLSNWTFFAAQQKPREKLLPVEMQEHCKFQLQAPPAISRVRRVWGRGIWRVTCAWERGHLCGFRKL